MNMNFDGDDLRVAHRNATAIIGSYQRRCRPIPADLQRHYDRLLLAIRCMSAADGFADETNSGASEPQLTHEDLLDAAEAAKIIGCSAQWVRRIHTDLDGQNIGGRWLFPRSTIENYAEERRFR
jgi:Helix-turn-helix domain